MCTMRKFACQWQQMDTLGFEPRAFRMRSGCDTTTPCALMLARERLVYKFLPDRLVQKMAKSEHRACHASTGVPVARLH